MGIEGEALPGSCSSTEFVNWYSGHPDAGQPFPLDAESVAVIGVGNVAVDVARVLAVAVSHLRPTDVPPAVLDALAASAVRTVHLIGRRGPEFGKFTTKELRELGELEGVTAIAEAEDLPPAEADRERHVAANLAVIESWVGRVPAPDDRVIHAHFWRRPLAILGTERVEGIRLVDTSPAGTGAVEDLAVQAVVRAVGYRSLPVPGLPFDDERAVVRNDGSGRVLGDDGSQVAGVYVAGWIKRGPTGVIGTNKSDAGDTARAVLDDLAAGAVDAGRPLGDVDALLADRGVPVVTYAGWLAIDAEEVRRGSATGRPREKVSDWEELRHIGRPPN
jgi:ferredoxin--NADP+ reductase